MRDNALVQWDCSLQVPYQSIAYHMLILCFQSSELWINPLINYLQLHHLQLLSDEASVKHHPFKKQWQFKVEITIMTNIPAVRSVIRNLHWPNYNKHVLAAIRPNWIIAIYKLRISGTRVSNFMLLGDTSWNEYYLNIKVVKTWWWRFVAIFNATNIFLNIYLKLKW